MTEKERIDYEIYAKKKARDKELGEWGCAGLFVIGSLVLLIIMIS